MERKHAFNQAVEIYAAARPGYPAAMMDDIIDLTGILPGSHVLEIGCGTGQSTDLFLPRGYRVTAVELGAKLAEYARRRFAAYPNFEVNVGEFESFESQERFDMVFSASAFHWIDPAIGFAKAQELLLDHGWLVLCWNSRKHGGKVPEPFPQIDRVYREIGIERTTTRATIGERIAQIEQSGCFEAPLVRNYPYLLDYTTEEYIRLLSTYSDHILMDPDVRERLFDGIREVIDGFGGRLQVPYLVEAYLARKKV